MLVEWRCYILLKETNLPDNLSVQSFGPWTMNIKQPLLLATWSKMNTIGHCIGIVQNMITNATLMEGVELTVESWVMIAWCSAGRDCSENTWCWTYHPSSVKVKPDLSIQTSTDSAHNSYTNLSVKMIHHVGNYPSGHYLIQCKILFAICARQQLLGSFIKLPRTNLSPETFALIAKKFPESKGESFVGIKLVILFWLNCN